MKAREDLERAMALYKRAMASIRPASEVREEIRLKALKERERVGQHVSTVKRLDKAMQRLSAYQVNKNDRRVLGNPDWDQRRAILSEGDRLRSQLQSDRFNLYNRSAYNDLHSYYESKNEAVLSELEARI